MGQILAHDYLSMHNHIVKMRYNRGLLMFIHDYLSTQNCVIKTLYISGTVGGLWCVISLFWNLKGVQAQSEQWSPATCRFWPYTLTRRDWKPSNTKFWYPLQHTVKRNETHTGGRSTVTSMQNNKTHQMFQSNLGTCLSIHTEMNRNGQGWDIKLQKISGQ
jgi:hypothetical protein